jgi:hypothetical protein
MQPYIILLPTVIRKQVIHHLIKETELCDVAKSDIDGSLIKAEHVHPRKEPDNLVYGTKPKHNTYVQSNIIHFHAACTVLGLKSLLSSNRRWKHASERHGVYFCGLNEQGWRSDNSKDLYFEVFSSKLVSFMADFSYNFLNPR